MNTKIIRKPVALVLTISLVLSALVQPCWANAKNGKSTWEDLKAMPTGLKLGIAIGSVAGLALGFALAVPGAALVPVLWGVLGGITGGFFGAFFSGMSFDSRGPDPKIFVGTKVPVESNAQSSSARSVEEVSSVRMGSEECQEAYREYVEACKEGNPEKARAAMGRYNELRARN